MASCDLLALSCSASTNLKRISHARREAGCVESERKSCGILGSSLWVLHNKNSKHHSSIRLPSLRSHWSPRVNLGVSAPSGSFARCSSSSADCFGYRVRCLSHCSHCGGDDGGDDDS